MEMGGQRANNGTVPNIKVKKNNDRVQAAAISYGPVAEPLLFGNEAFAEKAYQMGMQRRGMRNLAFTFRCRNRIKYQPAY